jgi:hypothetical protein
MTTRPVRNEARPLKRPSVPPRTLRPTPAKVRAETPSAPPISTPRLRASSWARPTNCETASGREEASSEVSLASVGKSTYPPSPARARRTTTMSKTETGLGTFRRWSISTGAESATVRSKPTASRSIVATTAAKNR